MAQSGFPSVASLRLFTDEIGNSHFEEHEFDFELDTSTSPSALISSGRAHRYSLRVLQPGWKRDWGPASRRTIAVYLSGEGNVEASDGDIRRVRPGMVLLAEDTTGQGHRAEVIGSEPLAVMHILLSD